MPASREFRIVMEDDTNTIPLSNGSSTRSVLYEGREISIDL